MIKTKLFFRTLFFTTAVTSAAVIFAGCSAGTDNTGITYEALQEEPGPYSVYAFRADPVTVNAFKLDTLVSVSVYQDIEESYLNDIIELCDYYEDMFSMHKEGGALYMLNEGKTDKVPAELGNLIKEALEWSARTDGRFQISIGRVSELWDFTSGSTNIPSDGSIKEALKTVDDSKIKVHPGNNSYDDMRVEKPEGTKIDLGAVAKGYIADKIKEKLISKGITSAVINLGGNILCVGDKNGEPFRIGIRKPFAPETDTLLILNLKDCSAISSGISERYFEKDGHIYHHILNPKTGYPYENELWQSTVISNDSLTGDILSTVTFTMGPQKALDLSDDLPDIQLILVKNDLSILKSEGTDALIN